MQSGMIYVAKGTQVAGPYTKAQLLEMERSGELADYQWIWEAEATGWKPLNAPPPDPTKSLHLEPAVQATPPAAASPVEMRARHLLAVCHDFRSLLSGRIDHVSAEGCVFHGLKSVTELSPFRAGAVAQLNLLDEPSRKSESIAVSVVSCKREDNQGHWILELSWNSAPRLLAP